MKNERIRDSLKTSLKWADIKTAFTACRNDRIIGDRDSDKFIKGLPDRQITAVEKDLRVTL